MHSKFGIGTTNAKVLLSLAFTVSGLALTACSSAGHGDASCARVISYQGENYVDYRPLGDKAENTKAGLGAWVYCDDNDGNHEPSDGDSAGPGNVPVFSVKGVDPAVAVAVGDDARNLELFVVSGKENSPEVQGAVYGK